MDLPVFLINLDRSPERLAFMLDQWGAFAHDKVPTTHLERVAGVDGTENVPAWLAPEFPKNGPLTPGRIGCYASHMVVAQQIIGRGLPCALVLEDDVTLDSDFVKVARRAVMESPAGWDIIHLSSHYKRAVVHVADIGPGRALVRHTRLPVNTAAYLISNAGARKLIAPRDRVLPNDMDFRYAWRLDLEIYGVFPEPARQLENFASDIGPAPRHAVPSLAEQMRGVMWMSRKIGFRTLIRARLLDALGSKKKKRGADRRAIPVIGQST